MWKLQFETYSTFLLSNIRFISILDIFDTKALLFPMKNVQFTWKNTLFKSKIYRLLIKMFSENFVCIFLDKCPSWYHKVVLLELLLVLRFKIQPVILFCTLISNQFSNRFWLGLYHFIIVQSTFLYCEIVRGICWFTDEYL